jgi:hypothetical protein
MTEKWIVFYHGEKELAAYTVRGTFSGEMAATIGLLSYEHNIPEDSIRVTYETR